jgi:hypothetical protein
MATVRAEILTPWHEYTEEGTTFRSPLVSVEYQIRKYQDITGQPSENMLPDPNIFSALIECDETVLAAIALDTRFFVVTEDLI